MTYTNCFKEFSHSKIQPKQRTLSPTKVTKNKPYSYQQPQQQQQNAQNKKAWPSTTFLKVSKKFEEMNSKPL